MHNCGDGSGGLPPHWVVLDNNYVLIFFMCLPYMLVLIIKMYWLVLCICLSYILVIRYLLPIDNYNNVLV